MKGVYVLVIEVSKNVDLVVGSLGTIRFLRGLYAYVGSAQNGLENRIERHLSDEKKIFWHVDYLLDCANVVKVFYREGPKSYECAIARRLCETASDVAGFGCSDCRCGAHLFRISGIETVMDLGMEEFCVQGKSI
ncbi:MAG: GIY-YIG nuclease family protein [Candidatus Aenigmarchaeota archaeon]|nr:GIY-YIG nuclease family protein [Candidatus Aenigmarchaeota archaeon]